MPANRQQTNLPESLKHKAKTKDAKTKEKEKDPEEKKATVRNRTPVTKASSAVNTAVNEFNKLKGQRVACEDKLKSLVTAEAEAKDAVLKARAEYDRLTTIT